MKPQFQFPLTLGSAWFAFATLAVAQAPNLSTSPPRIPRPPLEQSDVPTALDPSPTAGPAPVRSQPTSTARTPDATESGKVTTIMSSDDRFSRLYWDTDAEGTTWVRGRQYKASFGPDGATYYPLFGSKQPKHYPLQLSLASATSNGQPIALAPITGAVREGDNVVIHRGVVDEVYEMSVDGVEQTFVVGDRPQGDLKLFVSLQTELPKSERADGFEFTDDMGSVRYGQAFARETNHTRRPLITRGTEAGVEIDVDASYVASAHFPLVVDPLVSTFSVDASPFYDTNSNVAYDASTDRYLFVYQETVTSSDNDVYSLLYSSTGAFISGGYVDNSLADWYSPSVANLNASHEFMVVGRVLIGGLVNVLGRQTSATSVSWGPVITIASGTGAFFRGVSIGGDPYPSMPSYFCVAYERQVAPGVTNILARLVDSTGGFVGAGVIAIDTSPYNHFPCVSKGNGSTKWNIVWERGLTSIGGAQLMWDGSSLPTPSFVVSSDVNWEQYPSVSSPLPNGDYLVAWQQLEGTDHDIVVAELSGGTQLATADLGELEASPVLLHDQIDPHVDCDGVNFTVTYSEMNGNSPAYASTIFPFATGLADSESHIALGMPSDLQLANSIVSKYSTGGSGRRYAVSLTRNGPGGPDIGCALYDAPISGSITSYCFGDGTGTICPCANNGTSGHGCASSVNAAGALLAGSGNGVVSTDNVVLTASGLPTTASCLFFQGTTTVAGGLGAVFGDGLRCAAGTLIRLGPETASAGSASYPSGTNPHISVKGSVPAAGGERFYSCWYRNSGAFCTASTFNLTNGVRIVWAP